MTTFLFSRPFLYSSIPIGLGLGLSFFHPTSPIQLQLPFLSNSNKIPIAIQCEYAAPYGSPNDPPERSLHSSDSLLHKSGLSSPGQRSSDNDFRFLNATTMRQISLGSILGLLAGLGLRIFSRSLVFVIGVGVVLVEVCPRFSINYFPGSPPAPCIPSFISLLPFHKRFFCLSAVHSRVTFS